MKTYEEVQLHDSLSSEPLLCEHILLYLPTDIPIPKDWVLKEDRSFPKRLR
jgi:hypothetical protein